MRSVYQYWSAYYPSSLAHIFYIVADVEYQWYFFHSLTYQRGGYNFEIIIFRIDILRNSYEIVLRRIPTPPIHDKSTSVSVMAWYCQATSHYLTQCWPNSLSPHGVTRPQWVKVHQPFPLDIWIIVFVQRSNYWFLGTLIEVVFQIRCANISTQVWIFTFIKLAKFDIRNIFLLLCILLTRAL